MTNIVRLNQLPEGSGNLTGDDIFVFMDNPSGSGITKKISLSELGNAIGSAGNPFDQDLNTSNSPIFNEISISGSKIYGGGTNSGDGNGYGTLELVPDSGLYGGDQYLIIDPTGPNHVHLRAGGTIDNSNAEIIVGGEKNHLRINDISPLARLQTENLITLNTYYFNTPSPDFSSVVWDTFEGSNRVVINDPSSTVYDAVWALTSDSLFSVIDSSGNYYELTRNGSSTPGGSSPVMVYVDQAPPVNPTNLIQLTFEIRENRTTYLEANGSDVRIQAADDVRIYSNDIFRLYNYSANDPIEIITDYDDSDYTWRFQSDGSLQFPDGSVQKYAAHIPTVVQLGSVSGTINTDASSGSIFDLTLSASGLLANPSNSSDGQSVRWRITYADNSIPLSLDTNFRIPSSATSPLPFSSTSGSMDILGATYDSSRNKWDIIAFVPGY